jgi:hypothetical protein
MSNEKDKKSGDESYALEFTISGLPASVIVAFSIYRLEKTLNWLLAHLPPAATMINECRRPELFRPIELAWSFGGDGRPIGSYVRTYVASLHVI